MSLLPAPSGLAVGILMQDNAIKLLFVFDQQTNRYSH
jgi:hypothetical protein